MHSSSNRSYPSPGTDPSKRYSGNDFLSGVKEESIINISTVDLNRSGTEKTLPFSVPPGHMGQLRGVS